MSTTVLLANDHGGLTLRKEIITALHNLGFGVADMGVQDEHSVDYPDIAQQAAQKFFAGDYAFGILICGTGIGISIAANRIEGIRCALLYDTFSARLCKEHNNANFLAFGGRMHYHDSVTAMIEAYVKAEFAGGRHQTRIDKIECDSV
jgi:ribose 5-phosphate isomerase B